MINALLFMKDDYAFGRVLQQDSRTRSIPVAVHTASPLGELAERGIQAHGGTGILETPASAGELAHHIDGAFETARRSRREVRPVQWPTASSEAAATTEREPPATPSAPRDLRAPAQDRDAADERPVRPVDWARIAATRGTQSSAPSAGRPASSGERRQPQQGRQRSAPEQAKSAFRATEFEAVDPSTAKGGGERTDKGEFRQSEYPAIDPKQAKNRSRGRK
jgi:hypothetical protein